MNQIMQGDCLQIMPQIPKNSIDLILTSPPYANQRANQYGGINEKEYPEWFKLVADQMKRILKPDGNIIINIKENVTKGNRNTYVLKTILNLTTILNWKDTYIWNKTNPYPTGSKKRLKDGYEYCYWFTKTQNYQFYPNNVLQPSQNKNLQHEQNRKNQGKHNTTNGSNMNMSKRYNSDLVRPSNVITMPTDNTNHEHPATFPIGLPTFFIKLMTKKGDLVYDPFMGSGTTLLAAKKENRKYLGTEIIPEYIEMATERLNSFNQTPD